MPFFGVDDVLLLLASTTALLWAKRGAIASAGVYSAVRLATGDRQKAEECALDAERRHPTPPLLLRGFDLQEEYRLALELADRSRSMQRELGSSAALTDSADANPLVQTSVVSEFHESVVYNRPNVPHRHYNPHKRIRHVSALITYTEDEVQQEIGKYAPVEVKMLFEKIEREQLWEAAVVVSRGVAAAKLSLRHLTQGNVEAALRTLLTSGHSDLATAYYFSFGEDILPSEDIVVALFDAARHSEKVSLELYHALKPFQPRWTSAVYACCLTTTARFSYSDAVDLYSQFIQSQKGESKGLVRRSWGKLVASSLVLQEGGIVPQPPLRLQYLHHIIVPLVAEHEPERARVYVEDMLELDPDAAPDVFLKCLHLDIGQTLAAEYLESCTHKVQGPHADLAQLAFALYQLRPTAMNLNTLIRLMAVASHQSSSVTSSSASLRPAPRLPEHFRSSIVKRTTPESLASIRGGASREMQDCFDNVPLASDMDAIILARTLTEQKSSWGLAAQFMWSMVHRKRFHVVPPLATHLAAQQQWAVVSRAMSIYLSNQRGRMMPVDLTLCVEASVRSGQWSSALFWVERGHAQSMTLRPELYDTVLSISRHCTWQSALRVVTSMSEAGGVCTQQGVMDLLEASAQQGHIQQSLDTLYSTGLVEWVP